MQPRFLHSARWFTPEEANALLPSLVQRLDRIVTLSHLLHEITLSMYRETCRMERLTPAGRRGVMQQADELRATIRTLIDSFALDGIVVKEVEPAILCFPARRDNQEVFLCWRQGDPEVSHWHTREGGVRGCQVLVPNPNECWESVEISS